MSFSEVPVFLPVNRRSFIWDIENGREITIEGKPRWQCMRCTEGERLHYSTGSKKSCINHLIKIHNVNPEATPRRPTAIEIISEASRYENELIKTVKVLNQRNEEIRALHVQLEMQREKVTMLQLQNDEIQRHIGWKNPVIEAFQRSDHITSIIGMKLNSKAQTSTSDYVPTSGDVPNVTSKESGDTKMLDMDAATEGINARNI